MHYMVIERNIKGASLGVRVWSRLQVRFEFAFAGKVLTVTAEEACVLKGPDVSEPEAV